MRYGMILSRTTAPQSSPLGDKVDPIEQVLKWRNRMRKLRTRSNTSLSGLVLSVRRAGNSISVDNDSSE
ncbi:Transcription factor atf21 [Fusarium oxysporum f. sp. albedinis]|nr:Transcription factor atf21 [Fusarium oxysporum f. sp. albedinis]